MTIIFIWSYLIQNTTLEWSAPGGSYKYTKKYLEQKLDLELTNSEIDELIE